MLVWHVRARRASQRASLVDWMIPLAPPSEYSLGLSDSLVDVGREEEVLAAGSLDDIVETGLVDGEVVRVPGVDTGLVKVDNGDLDVGALERDNSAGGATDVTSTDWDTLVTCCRGRLRR